MIPNGAHAILYECYVMVMIAYSIHVATVFLRIKFDNIYRGIQLQHVQNVL